MSCTIFVLNNIDKEVNLKFYIFELSHHEIAIPSCSIKSFQYTKMT